MGILFLKKGHSKILLREKNFLPPQTRHQDSAYVPDTYKCYRCGGRNEGKKANEAGIDTESDSGRKGCIQGKAVTQTSSEWEATGHFPQKEQFTKLQCI